MPKNGVNTLALAAAPRSGRPDKVTALQRLERPCRRWDMREKGKKREARGADRWARRINLSFPYTLNIDGNLDGMAVRG